jgi:hypothetical protein
LQTEISKKTIPGYEPDPRIKAEPITRGRPQRSSGKKRKWRSNNSSASSKSRSSGKRQSSAR